MEAKKQLAGTVLTGLLLSASGTINAENLLDVFNLAIESDPTLSAAEAGHLATLEAKPQAQSGFRPQLNANGGFELHNQSIDDSPTLGSADSDFNRLQYGLNASLALYNKPLKIRRSQADASIAKADTDLESIRQSQIVSVAEAYFNVLSARDSIDFAKAEKDAISRQLEQSRERFEVGLIAITDVREAEAQFDLATSQEIAANNQLDIALENLHTLTGVKPGELSGLQEAFVPTTPAPASIDEWVEITLKNNLALQGATHDLETAKLEIKRNKSANLPTLGATASYGVQDDSDGFNEGRNADTALGLNVNWAIYNGGLSYSQTREAQHRYQQALKGIELQRRRSVHQTRAAYLNLISSISQVKALKQALASTETAHESAQAGFEVGTRTAVDVLLALRETYRAKRDYASARYNYILEWFRLKQASGTLGPDDVKAINKWL